jgi:hypothetical protein
MIIVMVPGGRGNEGSCAHEIACDEGRVHAQDVERGVEVDAVERVARLCIS